MLTVTYFTHTTSVALGNLDQGRAGFALPEERVLIRTEKTPTC